MGRPDKLRENQKSGDLPGSTLYAHDPSRKRSELTGRALIVFALPLADSPFRVRDGERLSI